MDLLVELIDQKKAQIQLFNSQIFAQQAERLKYQELVDEAELELQVCVSLLKISITTDFLAKKVEKIHQIIDQLVRCYHKLWVLWIK